MRQDYPQLQVLLVDNASTDDSVAQIREAIPRLGPRVELVQAPSNGGFASGCNIGIRIALDRGARFVWLLNNDTIAPPDTLTQLVAETREASVGMVGTVLRYLSDPGQIQAWGGGDIVRWLGYNRHFLTPTPLGRDSFLTFASVLIRRELLLTTGQLDAGFFMYFEDADLCFRARNDGWTMAVAEGTAVLHREGASSAPSTPRADRVNTASGLRFLARHGRPAPIALVLFLLSRLAKRLVRGDLVRVRAVLAGAADWWRRRDHTRRDRSLRDRSHEGRPS